MKSQKIPGPWGLGSRNKIWSTWAQKIYQVVSPEPQLQFSQKGPYPFQNHKTNPVKS